jgi:hypothetical protein
MRLHRLALGCLALVAAAGCYETPKPKCAFLCGTGGTCPEQYMCVAADNRCHLVENGQPATCEDQLPGADGAVHDAPEADAPPGTPDAPPGTPDATPMPDAPPPMIDASVPDASVPDASVPDAAPVDAAVDAM